MTVRVLFFASLKEEVGAGELEIPLAAETGLTDFLSALAGQLSASAIDTLRGENVRVAINQNLITGDVRIRPGDEVAFLPPVTGG